MNTLITCILSLFLSFNIVLGDNSLDADFVIRDVDEDDLFYEQVDWLNEDRIPWVLPIFQLTNSSIPSRRYNRTFKCVGILVKLNAVLTSRLCIKDNETYVVASNLTSTSSSILKEYPYIYHHKLYPAVHSTSYNIVTITKNDNTAPDEKIIIPGLVILFFGIPIRSISPISVRHSPTTTDIYSDKIGKSCMRISLIRNPNKNISTERFPEKISSYTEFVDAYSKFENNLIDKSIPDITFNDSVSVIATLDNESSDSETLLGSPLICPSNDNISVLTGLLIKTSSDGLNMYATVRNLKQWIKSKVDEFNRPYRHLPASAYDINEVLYRYDLE
ncbi:uncharacterized protein LOC103569530 [Microplitis demolitor]|uniref:uncharacterized protein LOC103569530 n=1 Tax=Microplitis demolitor TaxID=69319 RepID=UPI0004CD5FAB|nr:uncharacterized protein LOC103569530 [Microplitis demolitor]